MMELIRQVCVSTHRDSNQYQIATSVWNYWKMSWMERNPVEICACKYLRSRRDILNQVGGPNGRDEIECLSNEGKMNNKTENGPE